jgi:hypothetical protein
MPINVSKPLSEWTDQEIFRELAARIQKASPEVTFSESHMEMESCVKANLFGPRLMHEFGIDICCWFDQEGRITAASNEL